MNRIIAEYRRFASSPIEMKALLSANTIYALVLPVIEIFVAAYVLHESQQAVKVILYQFAVYAATPIAFLMNGFLLRWVAGNKLYAAGMVSSGAALFILMSYPVTTSVEIVLSGTLMGIATGIFWANRGMLALCSTTDETRNYFYGVETGVVTVTSVVVPLLVGTLIEVIGSHHKLAGGVMLAYRAVGVSCLLLTVIAACMVLLIRFYRPPKEPFLFLRFHPLWTRLMAVAVLKGVGQRYIVTAPALLILKFVGREGALGDVEAIGSFVVAICLYAIGRVTRPEHRLWVFGCGILLFFGGSVANAWHFDSAGALTFVICLLVAKPVIDLGYYPIQFHVVDVVSGLEKRPLYAYLFNHELATFLGRASGCLLFMLVAWRMSETIALRYALLAIGILQLPAIALARSLRDRTPVTAVNEIAPHQMKEAG
jgi:MFS transporter, YQGE family, putative transporter